MRSLPLLALALALILEGSPLDGQRAAAATVDVAADAAARVDALFAPWNSVGSPGCSVGISRNGATIYEKGFGAASIESRVPISPASVFHVASISKMFTAASIMLLARSGKLSIDDDVRRYIPEWQGPSVTVRQVLSHTAGLRDAFLLIELAALDSVQSQSDRLVSLLARQRGLNTPPGSEFSYNNGGYVLLAEIVKRVSGQPLRAFADAELFAPLAMSHTHFHDDPSMIVPNVATGYTRLGQELRLARPLSGVVGNAGLFTTTGDLLRWGNNLADGRVGGTAVVGAMQQAATLTTGKTSDYGLGLWVGRYRGLRTISHGGGDPGVSAYFVRYPDQGLAIAVLCNIDDIDSNALSQRIAEIYLGSVMGAVPPATAAPPPTSPTPPTPRQLAAYAGLYRDPTNEALVRIFVHDGQLRGSGGAGIDEGWPTTAIGPDRFTIPGTGISLSFEPSRDVGITLRVGGEREGVLERLAPFVPVPDSLAAFAGDYVGAELDSTYSITSNSGGLTLRIPGRQPLALQPIDPDGFAGPLVGVLRFTRNSDHLITGFTLHASGANGLRFLSAASCCAR
jgi:CubicO group peptidase (beta-lactamase class C family)